MDPVTLYAPDGRPVEVRSPREVTNLRASGYRDTPPAALAVETPPGTPTEEFDPGAHTVEQVNVFIAEHPELADSVLGAERAGKNRTGITGGQ